MKTQYFEINAPSGSLWCAYDYMSHPEEDKPLVIVTPAYEKTARESLTIANYLVLNGFRVLRFDSGNSVGLSYGNIEIYTMSSITSDIEHITKYACDNLLFDKPLSLLAMSLSARALLKYLSKNTSESKNIMVAMSIVGVADLHYTITQVANFDYFNAYLKGERFGCRKLLTYDIDYDNFMEDAIKSNFRTIESTIEDAGKARVPHYGSIMVSEDEWILPEQQKKMHDALINSQVEQFLISGASHKMWKNPRSAEIAIKNAVRFISKYVLDNDISIDDLIKPNITDIIEINRVERKVILQRESERMLL